ncbi:hypothetical protein [Acidiphilium angustum]|uniref:hypothetical protein n=1 Tax=Acidiphilium angustum TaxID=523 RepID=UPI0006911B0F|nr:hypothetical protein [Acidiphilium angustum]
MARIRSVHPGLFTDESFIELSDSAQIFFIGLWTEADDQGIFEWKPATLKLRLRGATTTPVDALLTELKNLDCVRPFSVGGKNYGAVRNFQRFQRPKKPNKIHPLPDDLRKYVGISGDSSEIEDDEGGAGSPPRGHLSSDSSELSVIEEAPVPTKAEIAPQMEDGGGRKEEEKKKDSPQAALGPPKANGDPEIDRMKPKKAKPRSQIPTGWQPTDSDHAYAEARVPDIPRLVEQFRNYHAAKGSLMADWSAAWRTWVGNEVRFAPKSHGSRNGWAVLAEQAINDRLKMDLEEFDGPLLLKA